MFLLHFDKSKIDDVVIAVKKNPHFASFVFLINHADKRVYSQIYMLENRSTKINKIPIKVFIPVLAQKNRKNIIQVFGNPKKKSIFAVRLLSLYNSLFLKA